MEVIYNPKHYHKVLVRCITYNQSKYIVDCLNGFAMQKTTFPFVCLIMDDCSTDGEIEVIKTWMEQECDISKAEYVDLELSTVILVPHRINEHCRFAFYLLKRNLYKEKNLKMYLVKPWRDHCEYEALCEGDDYWVDSQKLQKQVSILDSHSECGMCCTAGRELSSRGFSDRTIMKENGLLNTENVILKGGGYILTASVMYNAKMNLGRPEGIFVGATGDYPLQMYFALKSKIYYLSDQTCVYRANIAYDSFSNQMLRRPVAERMAYWRKEMNMLRVFDEYFDYKEHEIFNQARGNFMYHKFVFNPDYATKIFEEFPEDCACMDAEQKRKALFIKNHLHLYKAKMWFARHYYAVKSNVYKFIHR